MGDRRTAIVALMVIGVWCWTELRSADELRPKPSTFAPAKDLIRQLQTMTKRSGEDLSSEAEYGDDQRGRISKDANTMIVLAQLLSLHDELHAFKGAAPAIVSAAKKLADSVADFGSAQAAWKELSEAAEAKSTAVVTTDPIAEIGPLMKQVPIVNNALRRGVGGTRFAKTLDLSAAQSATLAAIAEMSSFDKSYCESPEDEALWKKVCAEMRDAAAEVLVAVRKEDQKAASGGLDRLAKTCDACHDRFRH